MENLTNIYSLISLQVKNVLRKYVDKRSQASCADHNAAMEPFEIDNSFVDDNSDQSDLTLIVDKHKIHVSKAVLCIASPVFRAMFRSDFKEKETNEIKLPGKNYNDVVSFLNCIYPDRMENVTSVTVYSVLPLAHEYQVNVLLKKCQEFLLQLVKSKLLADAMEICRHIQISEKYNLGCLNQKCIAIASEFSLEEFEKAAKKYPVTDDSLMKVHRQARLRDELNKKDDKNLSHSMDYQGAIKEHMSFLQGRYASNEISPVQSLRLSHRYFPDNENVLKNAFATYQHLKQITRTYGDDQPEVDIEKELTLLPERMKQKFSFE